MSAPLNSTQFRLESRIKGKPNSQGTLFSVNPSQRTPRSRQPRGYSPERYKAVGDAMDMQRRNFGPGTYGGHAHGGSSMVVYNGHADTMARGWADVARSTVPMSDITKPHPDEPASNENPKLHMGVQYAGSSTGEGTTGEYHEPGSTAIPDEGRIALYSGRYASSLAIHEIGHHVNYVLNRIPYTTPEERGTAEGFADKYAETHARTAGYKQKPDPGAAPKRYGNTGGWIKDMDPYDSGRFTKAYNVERFGHEYSGPLQEDQFGQPGHGGLPKNHVRGQLPLLDRVSSAGWPGEPEKDVRWDYTRESGLHRDEQPVRKWSSTKSSAILGEI